MDSKSQLQSELETLKGSTLNRIAELEAKIAGMPDEAPVAGRRWVPERVEQYYYPLASGSVDSCQWNDDAIDRGRFAQGLVFKSEKDANDYIKWRTDCNHLLDDLFPFKKGFKADWKDGNQVKFFLVFNHNCEEWQVDYYHSFQVHTNDWPLFADRDDAQAAIAHFGSRLNVLLGVEGV